MRFRVGNRFGNSSGNHRKNGLDWVSALKKINADKTGKNKRLSLENLAQKVWMMALDGDIQAIREIGGKVSSYPRGKSLKKRMGKFNTNIFCPRCAGEFEWVIKSNIDYYENNILLRKLQEDIAYVSNKNSG